MYKNPQTTLKMKFDWLQNQTINIDMNEAEKWLVSEKRQQYHELQELFDRKVDTDIFGKYKTGQLKDIEYKQWQEYLRQWSIKYISLIKEYQSAQLHIPKLAA